MIIGNEMIKIIMGPCIQRNICLGWVNSDEAFVSKTPVKNYE